MGVGLVVAGRVLCETERGCDGGVGENFRASLASLGFRSF